MSEITTLGAIPVLFLCPQCGVESRFVVDVSTFKAVAAEIGRLKCALSEATAREAALVGTLTLIAGLHTTGARTWAQQAAKDALSIISPGAQAMIIGVKE